METTQHHSLAETFCQFAIDAIQGFNNGERSVEELHAIAEIISAAHPMVNNAINEEILRKKIIKEENNKYYK